MKQLSLLLLLMCVGIAAMADTKSGAPSRVDTENVMGDMYYIYQRSNRGSAVNPETHTSMIPQDGIIEVVMGDGGAMSFIKNIVYGADKEFGDYWVEAVVYQDGSIYIPLGQTIYTRNRDGFFTKSGNNAVLRWGTVHYDASTNQATFTPNKNVESVNYTMTPDGRTIVIENTSGPVAIEAQDDVSYDATGLGIVWEEEGEGEASDDGEWTGYCEWGTSFDSSPYVIDSQPEGELKTYTRTGDCLNFSLNSFNRDQTTETFSTKTMQDETQIVFSNDGKKVYMKDPFLSKKYGTWVMGDLSEDGSQIVVNLLQYLNVNGANSVILYKGRSEICTAHPYNQEPYDYLFLQYGTNYQYGPYLGQIFYLIDGNTIRLQDSQANVNATYPDNCNFTGILYYDPEINYGAIEANIVYTLKTDTPDDPTEKTEKPVISGYSNDNYSYSIKITPAEPSTIYYRVLGPDGKLSEWATYLNELTFTEPGDYRIDAYAVAENKLPSDYVDYTFTVKQATSINELANDCQVSSKRYFNVMGQEIEKPNGMTIVVTTYNDGTTTTTKVMK